MSDRESSPVPPSGPHPHESPVPLWLEDQWAAAAARVARWKLIGFAVALAAWSIPSLFVGLVGLVGLVGWEGDSGTTTGLMDGDLDGFAALALAGMCDLAAGVSLVAIGRWAMPDRRARARNVALVGTFWTQLVAAIWLAAT